jgi:hypothetical protein
MLYWLASSPLAGEEAGGGSRAAAFPPILSFPHQGGRGGNT